MKAGAIMEARVFTGSWSRRVFVVARKGWSD